MAMDGQFLSLRFPDGMPKLYGVVSGNLSALRVVAAHLQVLPCLYFADDLLGFLLAE